MTYSNDDNQDELEDREFPEQADLDDDDDDSIDSEDCRHCGRPVYAGAEVCPQCHRYVSDEDSPLPRKPRWYIIGVVMALFAILVVWILLRLFTSN